MRLTTVKATSLLTVLCLAATLTMTSCGKNDKAAEEPASTPSAPPTGSVNAPPPAVGADQVLSPTEKAQLTPIKTALTMANSAVKGGDLKKAKEQFDKFDTLWKVAEPMVKSKAGASYPLIASGLEMFKTSMAKSGAPDKAKAGEGLTAAIKAIDALINKK
jgi:hypothetical protein